MIGAVVVVDNHTTGDAALPAAPGRGRVSPRQAAFQTYHLMPGPPVVSPPGAPHHWPPFAGRRREARGPVAALPPPPRPFLRGRRAGAQPRTPGRPQPRRPARGRLAWARGSDPERGSSAGARGLPGGSRAGGVGPLRVPAWSLEAGDHLHRLDDDPEQQRRPEKAAPFGGDFPRRSSVALRGPAGGGRAPPAGRREEGGSRAGVLGRSELRGDQPEP